MTNGTISIFMVAENRLLRETLARLLKKNGDFAIVGVSPGGPGISARVVNSGADVLIVDGVAARLSGPALISDVMSLDRQLKIVLIDMDGDEKKFLEYVRAGALGYVQKDAAAAEVVAAVRAVVGGRAVCPDELCLCLFRAAVEKRPHFPSAQVKLEFGLTRRQQQLVPLIVQGLTNKEIGSHLNISEQTVKSHIHSILRRIGATDRLQVTDLTRVWGVFQY
jgi:DNA-binding NarL/FixJ family response regulator